MSTRIPLGLLIVCSLLTAASLDAQTVGRRRALLIGINDYSASRIGPRPQTAPPPERQWPNLNGAANDAGILREMLPLLYGFDTRNIALLIDQSATRAAILFAIDELLVKPAEKDDVIFFYFAGHGSQVRNSRSDEPDKLDESIIPADSKLGAADIRDKELRVLFNRILDRGARLTVVFDNCHSGSGARGLPTALRPRGLKPDLRDVADGSKYGPRPEDRGALVLSAAQDFDRAWETRDEEGQFHGSFTWALLRAMRDSAATESARDTFLRAQARMRVETPYQQPVMAGVGAARLHPLLGARTDRRLDDRAVVAVEKVLSDGTVILQGGWANGLARGTELRVVTDSRMTQRLKVTAINGLGRSEARLQSGERALPQAIHSGALLEVIGWSAPAGRALRVSMPRVAMHVDGLTKLARSMEAEAARHKVKWIANPLTETPAYLLRHAAAEWELVDSRGNVEGIGSDDATIAAIAQLPSGSSLFVQFPAPAAVIDGISVGPGTDCEGIEPVDRPERADYILIGRYTARRITYAWMRPLVQESDRRSTGLPIRTDWISLDGHKETLREAVPMLRDAVMGLRRIHAWQLLESPPQARSPYRLALRRDRGDELVRDAESVIGGETYSLLLLARSMPMPAQVTPRYVYVFTIDSHGNSTLLFPDGGSGSVENRLPLPPAPAETRPYPPPEIALTTSEPLGVDAPYGIDTYFLLTTDEPLSYPWVLEWNGVLTRDPKPVTQLEQLLALTGSGARGSSFVTPTTWSIERFVCESVAPRKRRG